jgi:hypothetical protein
VSDRLNIRYEMARLDTKDRDFYDSLTVDELKKFSNFLMIRWSSQVTGPRELQEYYVQSCNHYLNKHFFSINKHPKLQWLGATAVSPDTGCHTHNWISPKKKDKGTTDVKKLLMKLYPNMKMDEIELMSQLNSKKELSSYLKDMGIDGAL